MQLKRVEIFSPFANIDGWFTKKNAEKIGKNNRISGLNCGFNSNAPSFEVEGNRDLLFQELGLEKENVAFAKQVHEDNIEIVDTGGTYPDTDALITRTLGLTLAIQVADCAAVLIAEPDHHFIAAIHAGWRGAIAGIVTETVKMMEKDAARPDRMHVYISPCISQQFFEVGDEVASQFPKEFVDTRSYKKSHVDLKGYIIHQLLNVGIPPIQIHSDPDCTYRDKEDYYSYRRENTNSGRMLALIQLN
jgi:polyphenol oxidase